MEKVLILNDYPILLSSKNKSISAFISLKKSQKITLGKVPKPSKCNGSVLIKIKITK